MGGLKFILNENSFIFIERFLNIKTKKNNNGENMTSIMKEFRDEDRNKIEYERNENEISVFLETSSFNNYYVWIDKKGTFSSKYSPRSGDCIAKANLANTLIIKYDYNSIKKFVENDSKSKEKIFDYLYNMVFKFLKVADINTEEDIWD